MSQVPLFDAETMARTEKLTPAFADRVEKLLEDAGERPWYVSADPNGPMIISFGRDLETDQDVYACSAGEAISASADAELVVALVNAAHLIVAMVRGGAA